MSNYDPKEYADNCYKSGATAATFMANTHSGLVNWPSKTGGVLHPAFAGRDMLKETIDALHDKEIDVIIYYVFVYVVDYWDKHPESRIVRSDGSIRKQRVGTPKGEARFATCCFNDANYRKYSLLELAEICDNYDFEGVWPDMTFWPTICYCDNCQKRYKSETGKELPRTINWKDTDFVAFVRVRQRWLREFCQEITDTVKSRKPGMKLAHQSQTLTFDWVSGASSEVADCWDWMSADHYCDRYGLSFSSKLFYALSNVKPFERINCWNYPNIHEHVITRTTDELSAIAYSTIMNDGALTIIDQIDPSGTLHEYNYRMMKKVFDQIETYEPYLGGEFVQDVGLYYSYHSNFDQHLNGKNVSAAGSVFEHLSASMLEQKPSAHMRSTDNAAKTLTMFHVPYGVVTKKNLNELHKYKVLILSNVAMMDEEELGAIREFVHNGGCLYASKETATLTEDGVYKEEGMLSDLFGVKYKGQAGQTDVDITYVSPTESGRTVFPEVFSKEYPLTIKDSQMILDADNGLEVLGTLTLPYEYPSEERYASLLTTPPGNYTNLPAIVEHQYGLGKTIYSSALLEVGCHITQRETFYNIIRRISGTYCTELSGYPSVEITRFEKKTCTMLHVLNYQAELPNIAIHQMEFEITLHGKHIKEIFTVPNRVRLPFKINGDMATITLPELKDYILLQVNYYIKT